MEQDERLAVDELLARYPRLSPCRESILSAYESLVGCFEKGHKLLLAGNGGSSADAAHIVGELMKSFRRKRPLPPEEKQRRIALDPRRGAELSKGLQEGLPALSLGYFPALESAFSNDVAGGSALLYAQEVHVLGEEGDVFWGISTSGRSPNLLLAMVEAKAKGMGTLALTGEGGGAMKGLADVVIAVPEAETFRAQELHLPVYHCLCLMLERRFFPEQE